MLINKLWWLSAALFLISCGEKETGYPSLTIAVASNLQIPMKEIASRFEKIHGIETNISGSSSGTLTAQIMQGAPYDVFLSANAKYPEALRRQGLIEGDPKVFAHGSLILWSLNQSHVNDGLQAIQDRGVRHFAIANPETAPYGIAAMQVLNALSLLPEVENKMVIGESISQVNQYVSSETVDVGITSSSVLFSSNLKAKGFNYIIDRNLYEPIEQVVVIVKNKSITNSGAARAFSEFLFSPQSQTLLSNFGYLAPTE